MASDSPYRKGTSSHPTFVPRHLRCSSSLLALETLVQPSPTLTTSDSLCSVRSGEIPIILSFLTTNSVETIKREDEVTNIQLAPVSGLKPGVTELARFSPMAAFFPMSTSSDSIGTSALGSNIRRARNVGQRPIPTACSRSSVSSIVFLPCSPVAKHHGSLLSPSCSATLPSCSPSGVNDSFGDEQMDKVESKFTISEYLTSPSVYGDAPTGAISSKADFISTEKLKEDCVDNAQEADNKVKSSISFTITKPLEDIGNKSPCVTSSRSLSTIQFSPLSTHTSIVLSPSPSTPSFTPPLTPLSANRTPTQATFLQHNAALRAKASSAFLQQTTSSRTSTSQSATEATALKPPCSLDQAPEDPAKSNSDGTVPPTPFYSLPVPCLKHAQWLRDCVVELWIDQEGFRAIRPRFFLASVSDGLPFSQERRSSLRKEDPLFSTVAEFLPVTREEHFFHHAALDRPPALHRITVNGDEGRDFITRQASLGLKENGVFYVQGTEDYKMSPPAGSGASRIVRLTWRFEYFVNSRKPGPRRKKIHQGEKIFKPLSFSCTPALLSPKRAIKVNVLHVMKKTLLPNLVAQKLDPPDLPIPPGSMATSPSSDSLVSIVISEPCSPFSESSPLTATPSRVRAAIESRRAEKINLNPAPIIGLPPRKSSPRKRELTENQNEANLESSRDPDSASYKRHRAQSTSEQKSRYSPVTEQFFAKTISVAGAVGLVRPIIAHEELSAMYAAKDVRNRHSITTDIVDNVQVTILPPAPRPRLSGV